MATPIVSGTLALMLSANRSLSAAQLKQRLIAGSDRSAALSNFSLSDGQFSAANAVLNQRGTRGGVAVTAAARPAPARMADALRLTLTRTGFFSVRAILTNA
jgi:subtilisin family serine protease